MKPLKNDSAASLERGESGSDDGREPQGGRVAIVAQDPIQEWTTRLRALEDHSYGGLAKRYKVHKRGRLTCLDPLALVPVSFSTELKYENWLMQWLDASVVSFDMSLQAYECLDQGQRRRYIPDLVVRRREDVEFQTVCRHEGELLAGEKHSHSQVAKAHGATFVLRPRNLIRADLTLLGHLETLRQRATMLRDRWLLGVQRQLMGLLPGTPWRIDELRAAIGHSPDIYEVDASLAHLCRAGLVSLDLKERRYGQITVIAHANRPRLQICQKHLPRRSA